MAQRSEALCKNIVFQIKTKQHHNNEESRTIHRDLSQDTEVPDPFAPFLALLKNYSYICGHIRAL